MAFVRIYNALLKNGKYKLDSKQLYFYCLLASHKSIFLDCTYTTIDLISSNQIVFNDNNNAHRQVSECRKIIVSLEETGVININKAEIKAHTPLHITFPVIDGGFDDLEADLWKQASNHDELYILAVLNTFGNGFEKAKDNWSSMLGYSSKQTGHNIVNRMISEGKIHCIEGKIYQDQGRTKQKPTKWYIGPAKQVVDKKTEDPFPDEINIESKPFFKKQEDDMDERIEIGNFKLGREYELTENDYWLYAKQQHNEKFKTMADKKFAIITKNWTGKNRDFVRKLIDDNIAHYNEKQKDDERIRRSVQSETKRLNGDFDDDSNFQPDHSLDYEDCYRNRKDEKPKRIEPNPDDVNIEAYLNESKPSDIDSNEDLLPF